jgi:vitamin B12 transporter
MKLLQYTFFVALATLALFKCADALNEEPYQMDPVYVSASRLAISADASGRQVTVIDSTEIARRGATSIADLLSTLPGIHVRTRGPLGVQTDLEMAGASFSQVLVLVDGMRVNDPQTGHHNLNLPFRLEDLERVEVVYGSGSAVHGPGAFGGVVNLVPRSTPQRQVELSTHWGSGGGSNSDLAAVASTAALRYGWSGAWGSAALSLGKERSDGYRDTTEFDIDRFYAQLRLPLAKGLLKLNSGLEDKAFGANDFYGDYPSKEWTKVWLHSAHYQRPIGANRHLVSRALYRRHRDRFVLWRHNPSAYENRHLSQLATAETHIVQKLGRGQLTVGLELNRESIDSNNLGQHEQTRSALFAETAYPIGAWNLSTGGRIDYSETYSFEFSPSLRLARSWGATRFFAGVGRAFRAPSFTEFFYEDPNNVGNADLEAERAWSYEAGLNASPLKNLRLQALFYARSESNLVDYIRTTDTPPWSAQNLGEIDSRGGHIEFNYSGWRLAQPALSYSWNDKTQTLAAGLQSKYVFTQPRQQLGLRLDHALPAGLQAHWQYAFRERQGADDYGVAQLLLTHSLPYGRARLRITNLTDATYEEVAGVPMPGRWFALETLFDL